MCNTCCALGVVGEYREHQFVVVTGVVSRKYGRFGGEDIIKVIWRNNEFRVDLIGLRWLFP
jgi:hypothetical protein